MTHEEMIAVIQAHKEGRVIQKISENGNWVDCNTMVLPTFNFAKTEYRIKPEPHKDENPLIQNLLDYFKNTTKEQRQKDWNEITSLYPDENEDWSEVFREPIPTAEGKPDYHKHKFNKGEKVNIIGTDINEIVLDLKFDSNVWVYSLTNREGLYIESQLQEYSEPHYRPFENTEEVMTAIKEHGSWICWEDDSYQIITVTKDCIIHFGVAGKAHCDSLFDSHWEFLDRTPFGVKEE